MIKIYHNNRCRKSREGLQTVQDSNQPFEVIDYISNPLSVKELEEIITILEITPIDLVRQNEAIWKSDFKGKEWSDEELIKAMATHPKLIERPIVVYGNKAVIGRPTERILDIL